MADGFSLDSLIDALAKRVAAQVLAGLDQDPVARVKPRLLTIEQAATYLGRSVEAIHHMIASGKVRTVRFDRRVFIDLLDLDKLIEDNRTAGLR